MATITSKTGQTYSIGDNQVNIGTKDAPNIITSTAPKPTVSPYSTQSTTTLSSDKTKDILNAQNTTTMYAKGGVTTDPNSGIATSADGKVFQPYQSPEPIKSDSGITRTGGYVGETYYAPGSQLPTDGGGKPFSITATSPSSDAILSNLNRLKSQSDALTASTISNIEAQYATLQRQQEQVNAGNNAASQGALFRSGAAQGDAYAQNTQNYQIQQGVNALSDLAAKKQSAIIEAQQAGLNNDFQLQEKINSQIAGIAQEQAAAGKALMDKIQAIKDKAQEEQAQSQKEQAIIDLYNSGTTDVATIAKKLSEAGHPTTLKEVSDNVALLSGIGGSGIVGEYNFYKAEAIKAGQVPVDFNEYQNMDANRKIKIAAATNAAGLTQTQMNTALKLSDDYEQRSKDYYSQREAYNRVISSASDPSPAGDLALIFNYMKVLDPNSTVREGEFATAQNSGSAFSIIGAKYNKILNGERLTETQRMDFVDRAKRLFDGAKKQQDSVVEEFKSRADKYGVPSDLVIRDTDATGNKAKDIIKTESDAEDALKTYVTSHPDKANEIDAKIQSIEKSLGRPATSMEFLQAFPEYGGGFSFEGSGSINAFAERLANAIKSVESGGNYNAVGDSGTSKGAYQFQASTWKGWANQYLGDANAPMTKANQDKVAVAKIKDLLKQGYSPKEVALIWNGGEPKEKKGYNEKLGVHYDSGAYAQKVLQALG